MPVSLTVVNHPATTWTKEKQGTSEDLLAGASPRHHRRSQGIIQSSFDKQQLQESHVTPSSNGFVWAAYHAYCSHHHLRLRPEDIWFAILTQLSFYINAHAEELRAFFVEHEGQKELEVVEVGTIKTVDFGPLAQRMTHLIQKNVVDPDLREWVMPSFTTTSDIDKVVASVLFMGAMQKYFSFRMTMCCGIPSVTLLGDIEDWQDILQRLDKIDRLGKEPAHFASLLRPILRMMVRSFEDPTSEDVVDFWNRIAHHNRVGSGTDYITGWLTAFCYWDEQGATKGSWQGGPPVLEGISYPSIDIDKVPAGFASVPVTVDDNGVEFKTTMVAGSVGIEASSGSLDVVQAVSGWWMYENEKEEVAEERRAELARLKEEQQQLSNDTDDDGKWDKYMANMVRMEELQAF